MDTGIQEEGKISSAIATGEMESNNKLPRPAQALKGLFMQLSFANQTPNSHWDYNVNFNPFPHPAPHSFAVCRVLLEPSARSSPSSPLCLLIWQLHFIISFKISVSKLLRQKVFDRLEIISEINKEPHQTLCFTDYRGRMGVGEYIYIFNGKIKVFGIKRIFTNAIYLTKAPIYSSTASCHCRIVSRSSSRIDRSKRHKYCLTGALAKDKQVECEEKQC